MQGLIKRPENPAKAFLRRYTACKIRMAALERAIRAAQERATSTAVRLKPIMVKGSGAAYDRMAEDVCRAADEVQTLYAAQQEAAGVLAEIMQAISAVPDEMQKTVLTLRYVEGLGWLDISEKIGYEISNTYILHGRALWNVKKWMEGKQNGEIRTV